MAEINDVINVPFELEIAGKRYKAGKLTIEDMAAFTQHIADLRKDKIVKYAKEIYGDKMPEHVWESAVRPPTKAEIDEYQNSVIGFRFLLWRALSKYNPNMTLEEVGSNIVISDIERITNCLVGDIEKKAESPAAKPTGQT